MTAQTYVRLAIFLMSWMINDAKISFSVVIAVHILTKQTTKNDSYEAKRRLARLL